MKHVLSISLGSAKRDKASVIEWEGEKILLERIGTNGQLKLAKQLFKQYDGKVEAFGLGGANISLGIDNSYYNIRSIKDIITNIRTTPIVDGSGLKSSLEKNIAGFIDQQLPSIATKNALIVSAIDRWGLAEGFSEHGYQMVYGDLMFALQIPLPIKSKNALRRIAHCLLPIVSQLPFKILYPTGAEQEKNTPKYKKWYQWASVIAGDCHYIKQHMPSNLSNKVVVTNTTTEQDKEFFQIKGVTHLITTTPQIDNRSFGTNVIEAAIVALSGKNRRLDMNELEDFISRLKLKPSLQIL